MCVYSQIREECEVFQISDTQLREIMKRLHKALLDGLGKKTHAKATVKCWPTYIQDLPNGKGEDMLRTILVVS